jgi:two-component system, cell cycle response regulator
VNVVHVVLAHADPGVRSRFVRVLEHVGHVVDAVDSAQAAVDRCIERPPDVVLVDVELCRDDDEALLAALKGDAEAYRSAVVLLERADLDLDAAVAALRRGVQDFLVEPISDAELVARVEAAGRTKVLQEELVVQSERLEALLFEDSLTGLSNRRFILTQLTSAVSAARRHERALSIAMIDIDHFKAINDTHGHDTGDAVLRHFADTCRARIRGQDMLGRMGGEEFLLVLPGAGTGEALGILDRLRQGFPAAMPAGGGHDLPYTFSVGVAEAMRHDDRGSVMRRADRALYAAKREGRNRTKIDVAAFGTG